MNGESQKILSGNLEAWCFRTLAGINYDPARPGFRHVLLKPQPVDDLTFVSASHKCLYGTIRSDWQRTADTFLWQVVVPPNTMATVYVPTSNPAGVLENGRPVAELTLAELPGQQDGCLVLHVPAGQYAFRAAYK
jgi:alpha-L-rhamnosidase